MTDTIVAEFMGETRRIPLKIGGRYEIKPLNIAKAKNVGRTCVLLAMDDSFMPSEADVKWEDTGRKGKVKNLSDLLFLEEPA
jgi:hypothetical protein